MRILLLKLALVPHRIWSALWACATAIDMSRKRARERRYWKKRRRDEPVYGWKGDPRGGDYFDPPDGVTPGGASLGIGRREDLPGKPWEVVVGTWLNGVKYLAEYPTIEMQERLRHGKEPLERYKMDDEKREFFAKHRPDILTKWENWKPGDAVFVERD